MRARPSRLGIFLCLLAFAATVGIQFYRFGPRYFGLDWNPPRRAFYYWKTRWTQNPQILSHLQQNQINRLYMRYFDVEWDRVNRRALPVSPLSVEAPLPANTEIIPVVYLTNAVFVSIPYAEVEDLAGKVWQKVTQLARQQQVTIRELQLDCDWSPRSRRSYFHFAQLLRKKLNAQGIEVSSTIRLHQIKYAARTGIPPVDRGMLMFYNFGPIKADTDHSSIFNARDAARYSSYIARYELPLDISLAIFSWGVHSRDGKVIGLINKLDSEDYFAIEGFEKLSPTKIRVTKPFFFHGTYYAKDDLLLIEEMNPALTRQAAQLAIQGSDWKKHYKTVAIFDIDERNLARYDNQDIQQIFKQF